MYQSENRIEVKFYSIIVTRLPCNMGVALDFLN